MEKNDLRSLALSIIINTLIILLIPGMKMPVKEEGKISVGLIELREENRKITPKKQEEKEEKPAETVEVVEEKPVEKVVEDVAEKVIPKKKLILPEIDSLPEINIEPLTIEKTVERKAIIAGEKKKERLLKKEAGEEVEITGAELEKREIAEVKATPMQTEGETGKLVIEELVNTEGEIDGLDKKFVSETDKLEGLPKGYKDIGSTDGSITGKWDEDNEMPVYPEAAELSGKAGTVVLKVYVTEEGRVKEVDIRKSGIPELDEAVVKVAKTWKIHLSKNGKSVYGDVTLEIPFRLLRGE